MGYKGRDYTQFTYAPQQKVDPLEKALDTIAVISLGISKQKHEKELLDEQLNYRARNTEINRLMQIDPYDIPSDYGDPWNNPDDYLTYKTNVLNNNNMKNLGKDYKTDGVVLSDEAMNDVFSYGDESVTVEMTPTGLGMNDVLNFDAWLLGDGGQGREIAKRHNWTGLLEKGNYDEDLGGYVLDELDYRDLQEKGLIDNITNNDGLYILNETQRNKVEKNYSKWREGFLSANTLPTDREVEKEMHAENNRVLKARQSLRGIEELKPGFQAMDNWTVFATDPIYGIATVDEKTNQVDKLKVNDKKGNPVQIKYDKFVTDEHYEKLQQFLNLDIETAIQFWFADPAIRNEFSQKAPDMYRNIQSSFDSYLRLQSEFDKQGIDQSKVDYINNSKVQVDGRNIILDDLRTGMFANNILFDDAQFDLLGQQKQDEVVKRLVNLEQSYINPSSDNYNLNVVHFLELYGLNVNDPNYIAGDAIINLIEEMGAR
tara:strand:+ start:4036 stop:5493 length:1458 start_codon:yes stop_codon:yes gene_type:complete